MQFPPDDEIRLDGQQWQVRGRHVAREVGHAHREHRLGQHRIQRHVGIGARKALQADARRRQQSLDGGRAP